MRSDGLMAQSRTLGGGAAVTRRSPRASLASRSRAPAASVPAVNSEKDNRWSAQDSWTVRSGWGWRAFLVMALMFLGAAIILAGNHMGTLAILWVVIAVGWFATSMWLWRQHSRRD